MMIRIKMYGLGGQGVVTAAKILSIAVSVYEDRYAITIPAYGHERRGAPVYTDMVVDDKRVMQNCYVYEPDLIVIFEETLIDKNVDVGLGSNANTVVIINSENDEIIEQYKNKFGFKKVYKVGATQISINNIGLNIPNSAMLGAIAKSGYAKINSVENAIAEYFGERGGEENQKTARESYDETKVC